MGKTLNKIVPDVLRPHSYFSGLARRRTGQRVISGPFKGMRYASYSVGSTYVPKLLGIYERELAATIEDLIASAPALIVDVGAAEGYYAVGLATRLPAARMIAFEMQASGRAAIAEMAKTNGVADRVDVRGACDPKGLNDAIEPSALVIMDVEGFESVLLDPVAVPALAQATILVELHEFAVAGITQLIADRFSATHTIEHIWAEPRSAEEFPWRTTVTNILPARYTAAAVNEYRPKGMSWFVMRPKGS